MNLRDVTWDQELYNGLLETGVRALVVLNAAYPMRFDLSQMTWFDHLVVHTSDIAGPESLHPDLPHRSGEMLVRRPLIEQSLALMRRLHLVEVIADESGIFYQATDEAFSFVNLMRSRYATSLKKRAKWLAENVCILDRQSMEDLVAERIGRWSVEFSTQDNRSQNVT